MMASGPFSRNSLDDRRCLLPSNDEETEFRENDTNPNPPLRFDDFTDPCEEFQDFKGSQSGSEITTEFCVVGVFEPDFILSGEVDNAASGTKHPQELGMSKEMTHPLRKYVEEFPCLVDFEEDEEEYSSNIQDIIEKFKICAEDGRAFVAAFPVWKENRLKIIKKLRKFAKSLDKKRFKCNVSRLASSSFGVIGGGLSITGAVFMPFTAGVGSTMVATAAAANVATAITETSQSKKLIKKAKKLIKKDEKQFKILTHWFEHSEQFSESVKKIIEFDIFTHLLDDIRAIKQTLLRNTRKDISLSQVIESVAFFFMKRDIPEDKRKNMILTIMALFRKPDLLALILHLHSSNPLIYEAINITGKVVLQLTSITDAGVDLANTLVSVVKKGSEIGQPITKVATKNIFAGLAMAFDVLTLVLTSLDVRKGSKNEHSCKVECVARTLEDELVILTQLNEELQKMIA